MTPSFTQILIVAVLLLIFFGPARIPGLGKSLGQAIRGLKKGLTEDEKEQLETEEKENIDNDTNKSV